MDYEDYKNAHDRRPTPPLFAFDWVDALILLPVILMFVFLAWDIIKYL